MMKNPFMIVTGPTGVGKTALSLSLAKKLQTEIISADSMQIYQEMDIGTAKVSHKERKEVTHHLIDIVKPGDYYSVENFAKDAKAGIAKLSSENKIPLIVGGTGLYLHSLLVDMNFRNISPNFERRQSLQKELEEKGLSALSKKLIERSPEGAKRIDLQNPQRVLRALEILMEGGELETNHLNMRNQEPVLLFVLHRPREILYERINQRVDTMLELGLIDEVRRLSERYGSKGDWTKAIGYRQVIPYVEGRVGYQEMIESLKRDSRRYAKRQLTWFRRYDDAIWIDMEEQSETSIVDFMSTKVKEMIV